MDVKIFRQSNEIKLKTDLGYIDLYKEVAGIGAYKEVNANAVIMILMEIEVKVLTLEALIRSKRAAGRPIDLLVLPELEALLKMQKKED